MKKILILLALLLLACPALAENITYGFYNENEEQFYVEGLLTYVGTEKVTRYKKAIDLKCDKLTKQCEILYAHYINNGKLEPTLFPTKENCKILTNQKSKKIIFCPNDFIYKIYVTDKKMTIEKDSLIYQLNWI